MPATERAPKAPPSLSDLLTPTLVKIYVGTEAKEFHVHRDLLCARSAWFQGCLTSGFREDEENEIRLAEETPSGFELFVAWLYGDVLKQVKLDELKCYESQLGLLAATIDLYVMSDKFCLEGLKNRAMDIIRRCLNSSNDNSAILAAAAYAYPSTTLSDPLRLYVSRKIAWEVAQNPAVFTANFSIQNPRGGQWGSDFASVGKEFGFDAFSALTRHLNGAVISPKKENDCDYHVHKETPKCTE